MWQTSNFSCAFFSLDAYCHSWMNYFWECWMCNNSQLISRTIIRKDYCNCLRQYLSTKWHFEENISKHHSFAVILNASGYRLIHLHSGCIFLILKGCLRLEEWRKTIGLLYEADYGVIYCLGSSRCSGCSGCSGCGLAAAWSVVHNHIPLIILMKMHIYLLVLAYGCCSNGEFSSR